MTVAQMKRRLGHLYAFHKSTAGTQDDIIPAKVQITDGHGIKRQHPFKVGLHSRDFLQPGGPDIRIFEVVGQPASVKYRREDRSIRIHVVEYLHYSFRPAHLD
ncbi:hypothetical protein D3C81_1755990 [compost metagenome]